MNYQYTYFIYPYVIEENKYSKYIQRLLKDKKIHMKIFDKQKDLDIYKYFIPNMRKYIFPTFSWNKIQIKNFRAFSKDTQAAVISKYACSVFEYDIGTDTQGKTDTDNGIFFKIQKIQMICFNTGICFLLIKTNIEDSQSFEDLLNFNYKFRDVKLDTSEIKEFENIKIQTNTFEDMKKLKDIIDDLTGDNTGAKELGIETERFICYSYVCIDQSHWNETNEFNKIKHQFYKLVNVLPSNYNANFDKNLEYPSNLEYIKIGNTKISSCLMTSNINTYNYTKLPFKYENEYLYTYILTLYKKIYLNKINLDYKNKNSIKVKDKFIQFTKDLWIQEITNNEEGNYLIREWEKSLELEKLYLDLKNKYDILYKELNIEKTSKINKVIVICLIASLIVNIINFIILAKK